MQQTQVVVLSMAIVFMTLPAIAGPLGSDWHDDPDGDGVSTPADLCPWVYDPAQVDDDLDGLGNPCDPDFAPPANDGPITDLRIEHATPYGAWFSFTSPRGLQWGWDATIAATSSLENGRRRVTVSVSQPSRTALPLRSR